MIVPKLPEGDFWAVEKTSYPKKGRTLRIEWWSDSHPVVAGRRISHRYTVASVEVKPRYSSLAFLLCYVNGLKRKARDRRDDKRQERDGSRIRAAKQAAKETGQVKA